MTIRPQTNRSIFYLVENDSIRFDGACHPEKGDERAQDHEPSVTAVWRDEFEMNRILRFLNELFLLLFLRQAKRQ